MTSPGNNKKDFDYQASLKKKGPGFLNILRYVDIYLNRPIAGLIVRAVYKTPITPNGLTYFSFLLGLLGAFSFSRARPLYFIIGGILAHLSSIIDGADGMLARARGMCSDYGAHLDLFFDRIMDFSVMVGFAFGAGTYYKSSLLLTLGLLTAGLYLLETNLYYIIQSYRQAKQTGETGEFRAILFWIIMIFSILNRTDILVFLGLALISINNLAIMITFFTLAKKKTQ
jgi:phosphatidylglycerophosphate synthase